VLVRVTRESLVIVELEGTTILERSFATTGMGRAG
jgi:hypothetical protein